MNLSDSKKKLALAGVVCGIVAACLAALGNPANMAFCIACFIRDTAGAMGMHQAEVYWEHLSFLWQQKNIAQQQDHLR